MLATTLISSPDTKIDPALATALRNAWGGGELFWLAPDQACEFQMPRRPTNHATVWKDLNARRIDMVVQHDRGRKKRLLLADMDSTMIDQECIDELADVAGVGAQVAEITARAMHGEIDFEGALQARVALLKGLRVSAIDTVLKERITLAAGGAVLLATMRAHGAYAALVSGGFTVFTADVAERLGFHEHQANTLLVQDGRITGQPGYPILGREAKVQALEELTRRLGLSASDVLSVGDGANDLGMLQRAGAGVAMHAKPAVAANAEIQINHGDLTALLYLQGYSRDEFVDAPQP